MKRKILPLSLAVVLSTVFLGGCSKKTSVVKNKVIDGKSVLFSVDGKSFFADDLLSTDVGDYNSFFQTEKGAVQLFSAIEDVLIQQIASNEFSSTIKNSIDTQVEIKMDDWNDEVEAFAKEYGISRKSALKAMLAERGFTDPKELELYFLIEEQRKEALKKFKDLIEPTLLNTTDNTLLEDYVENSAPMVAKHILVSISNSADIYTKPVISENEASKLGTVINQLKEKSPTDGSSNAYSYDFASIARMYSDDGSAANGGNLGIVDTYTSFVNEFKFGLYAAKIAQKAGELGELYKEKLGLSDELDNKLFGPNGVYPNQKFRGIPVEKMVEVLADNYDDKGEQNPGENKSELYPRNIEYNKYFNFPGVQFLVKGGEETEGNTYSPITDKNKLVLDSNGNPIIVVKSQYGIHFISVTYDSLAHLDEFKNRPDSEVKENVSHAVKYFMYGTNISSKTSGDVDAYNEGYVKNTFYNQGISLASTGEANRRNEIDSRVLNYVKGGYPSLTISEELYSFKFFKYYLNKYNTLQIHSGVSEIIENYMNLKEDYYKDAITNAINKNWNEYYRQVDANLEMRRLVYGN